MLIGEHSLFCCHDRCPCQQAANDRVFPAGTRSEHAGNRGVRVCTAALCRAPGLECGYGRLDFSGGEVRRHDSRAGLGAFHGQLPDALGTEASVAYAVRADTHHRRVFPVQPAGIGYGRLPLRWSRYSIHRLGCLEHQSHLLGPGVVSRLRPALADHGSAPGDGDAGRHTRCTGAGDHAAHGLANVRGDRIGSWQPDDHRSTHHAGYLPY